MSSNSYGVLRSSVVIRSPGARSGLVAVTSHLGRGHVCARTKALDGLVAGGIAVAGVDRVEGRRGRLRAVRERPGAAARARQSAEHLFAVNTPDNRLEIFQVQGRTPVAVGSVPVGLSRSRSRCATTARSGSSTTSPTASASSTSAIPGGRASCARCSSATSRATSSSPGPERSRAFITTAHRGQNMPVRSRSSPRRASAAPTSGSSTPTTSATRSAGTPLTIITLFTDTPRALAVTPDGSTRLRGGVPLRQPDHHRHERSVDGDLGRRARRRSPTPHGEPQPQHRR